jgi:hypothetical protein
LVFKAFQRLSGSGFNKVIAFQTSRRPSHSFKGKMAQILRNSRHYADLIGLFFVVPCTATGAVQIFPCQMHHDAK